MVTGCVQDGNLSSLAAELRLADLMDVNELSYGQFKYTALLLAVLYDHYQVCTALHITVHPTMLLNTLSI